MEPLPIPTRFAIFHHPKVQESLSLADQIAAYLTERGASAENYSIDDEANRARALEADMLIALGGDGTMLRAGRIGAFNSKPVLGINLGRLGFLMDVQPDDWQAALDRVLKGDYRLEQRQMLHASRRQGEKTLRAFEVLNEVVISRGTIARPIRLQTYLDGTYLTTYVADGLIVATPTGSTAYALAAGGPILSPEAKNMVLVPIAPHLAASRALVLPEGTVVEVIVRTEHQAIFNTDGQSSLPLQDGDIIRIKVSWYMARFVRLASPDYFYTMLADRLSQNPVAGKAK